MPGHVRTRPLLLAACIVGAIVGILLLFVVGVATFATLRNSDPRGFAGGAAEMYAENPQLFPFQRAHMGEARNRLRGVSQAEAMALLRACTDDKWVSIGDEERKFTDCARIQLVRCDINDKTLVARMWGEMGYGGVEFLACKGSLCPDFAVGEPSDGIHDSCGTPLKLETK